LHCVYTAATFADSDGFLSDGGEFYSVSKRPSALLTTIPIVKTEKVS